jgi:hypothetical protein
MERKMKGSYKYENFTQVSSLNTISGKVFTYTNYYIVLNKIHVFMVEIRFLGDALVFLLRSGGGSSGE